MIIYNSKLVKCINYIYKILHINFKIKGITLFPLILTYKDKENIDKRFITHECIHILQNLEIIVLFQLLFVFLYTLNVVNWIYIFIPFTIFYVIYVIEWLLKLFMYGNKSYYNISFEREAFKYEIYEDYLKTRKLFKWIKFLRNG